MSTTSSERVAVDFAPPATFAGLALAPEGLCALAIAVAATAGFVGFGPVPLVIAVLLSVAAWGGAVWSGSHGLAITSVVATLTMAGLGFGPLDAGLLVWTLVGVAGVAQLDAYRVSHLRRRQAQLHPATSRHIAIGTGRVALVSVVFALVVVLVTSTTATRSWLLVPAASLVLLVTTLVVLTVVARGRSDHDRERWTPGQRLPSGGLVLDRSPDQPPPPR